MKEQIIGDMNRINADGIDFVSLGFPMNPEIYESYTKEKFKDVQGIPKTNRAYWKMFDGEKLYYFGENESGYTIWRTLGNMKRWEGDKWTSVKL